MSTATLEAEKKQEGLLSNRRRKIISNPFDSDNPVTVQVLGICSALAVTAKMEPTLVMAIAVTLVVAFSNLLISLMRNIIPNRIRIIVQLAVVATLVILVDQMLKAYLFDVSRVVGVYVGLIITNCIVMGRLEAFAMANKPYDSFLDGLGNGLGYSGIILLISVFRELTGAGSLMGFKVFAAMGINYPINGLIALPVGSFFVLAGVIWIQRYRNGYTESH